MKIWLAGAAVAILLAHTAGFLLRPQQQPAQNPVGTWRGTSTCVVRPSACKDEITVYRIAYMKGSDSLALDGRKVVNGEEVEMGVLSCQFISPQLTCAIPQGTWHFRIQKDSLFGELRQANNTKVRDVRAARSP